MLMPSSSMRNKFIGIGLAAGALAAAVGGSGAYFTDQQSLHVTGSTGSLSILVDGVSNNTAALAFGEINPGMTVDRTFTVKNNGSVAADISIGSPSAMSGTWNVTTAAQKPMMSVGIKGFLADTPLTQLGSGPVQLGSIPAGASYTYTVEAVLSPAANDEWQNASGSATVQVIANQHHN